MKWLAVFLAMGFVDVAWAWYIMAVGRGRAGQAAFASGWIILFGGFATIAYIAEPGYLVPAILGAMAGTYLMVRYG